MFKIFEKVILKKLHEELKLKRPIHPQQAGFTQGKSTLFNIDALAKFMKQAREMAYNERRRTKVVKNRNWIYVTFLDLRKAFDSVDRVRLV